MSKTILNVTKEIEFNTLELRWLFEFGFASQLSVKIFVNTTGCGMMVLNKRRVKELTRISNIGGVGIKASVCGRIFSHAT